MQISNNYNSINVLNQQQKHQQEDNNMSLREYQTNDKQENQNDEITFSQQQSQINSNVNDNSQIQIFVQIPNGRILSFDVNNNEEYLQQITDKILQREGIPPDIQKLYLGPKFLNKINSSQTIKKYSTLHLQINCKTIKKYKYQQFNPNNTIIVKYNNQRHIINVNIDDYVHEIKHQLEMNFDYPLNSQELYFKNEQLLENNTLLFYKIQKNSIVMLKLRNLIYINQESKNKKIMINLQENETIKDLKTILNLKYSDLGQYHLLYRNVILQNEILLRSYNICDQSILQLVEIKYIRISIETQTITLQIKKEQYETILEIKKEIESQLQFTIHIQHLFYKGKELENNLRIIDCNIEEDSKLYLFNNLQPPYEITIIDSNQFDDFTIRVNPNNKVYELKQKISDNYFLIPSNLFILRYNGKKLKDEKDLSYYNIQNFDYLFMENDL